jgi:hypothetical protein
MARPVADWGGRGGRISFGGGRLAVALRSAMPKLLDFSAKIVWLH